MGCLMSLDVSLNGLQSAFLEYETEATIVSNINFPVSGEAFQLLRQN